MLRNIIKTVKEVKDISRLGYKIGCQEDMDLLKNVMKYERLDNYPRDSVNIFHKIVHRYKGKDVYSYGYNLLEFTPYLLINPLLYHYDKMGTLGISCIAMYFHYISRQCGYLHSKDVINLYLEKEKMRQKVGIEDKH